MTTPIIEPRVFVLFGEIAFLVFAIGFPLVRMRLRTGDTGLATHSRDPIERVVVFGLAVFMVVMLVWAGLLWFLGPGAVATWGQSVPLVHLGMVMAVLGLLLVVIAQAQMGASWRIGIDEAHTELIDGGLFRLIRNPIYSGVVLSTLGIVLIVPSAWTISATVIQILLIAIQARLEEAHLVKEHGETYRRYASQVGRFVPCIGTL